MTGVREIPTLLVVVPLGVSALAVMLWWLHRHDALTGLRIVTAVVWCVYCAGVVANTVLPIYLGQPDYDQSWTAFLNLTPFTDTDAADMLQNVLVFLPLGVLVPVIFRDRSASRVLVFAFFFSLVMETLQLINSVTTRGGHVADVNDLCANTVGGIAGYGLFRVAILAPPVARLVEAATWPRARAQSVAVSR